MQIGKVEMWRGGEMWRERRRRDAEVRGGLVIASMGSEGCTARNGVTARED
jgi:hypothetical protein